MESKTQSNLNNYSVGDVIINDNGNKYFVARVLDNLEYTIICLTGNKRQRIVVTKERLHKYTKLSLSSKLNKI